MRALLYFLIGITISMIVMLPHARAQALATPQIAGYSGGKFSSPAGSFGMTAANDGFVKPSVINVGGRPVTIPATLRMASNAGNLVKGALRITPWGMIAGTLAAGWLADQGIQWLNGEWQKQNSGDWWSVPGHPVPDAKFMTGQSAAETACANDSGTLITYYPLGTGNYGSEGVYCQGGSAWGGLQFWRSVIKFSGNPTSVPAMPEDWDALPDPLPAIVPELPYAPYLPDGVPVEEPEFAPQIVPLGLPYTAPDGSTWQPMADIQPAGDGQVRVRPYDEQLTEPDGTPIPQPDRPTAEVAPEQPTQCDKYPNSLGCMQPGAAPAPETIPTTQVPLSFTPMTMPGSSATSCPAPETVSLGGHSFEIRYDGLCYYAEGLRPFVILGAYITAAMIIFGVIRGGSTT